MYVRDTRVTNTNTCTFMVHCVALAVLLLRMCVNVCTYPVCKMPTCRYRSEVSLYSVLGSPMMVGTDIRLMTAIMNETLLNTEMLAVNQARFENSQP
jgi:hypothetical protein